MDKNLIYACVVKQLLSRTSVLYGVSIVKVYDYGQNGQISVEYVMPYTFTQRHRMRP